METSKKTNLTALKATEKDPLTEKMDMLIKKMDILNEKLDLLIEKKDSNVESGDESNSVRNLKLREIKRTSQDDKKDC
jgi:hypothetical protein